MSTVLYVYNATLCGKPIDVVVENGLIASVTPSSSSTKPDGEYVDATGYKIFPSFLDIHTHTREPGYTSKETIATALSAAVHGGFSGIMCMANTKPVNDTPMITEYMLAKAKEAFPNGPFLYPIGAATIGLKSREVSPMLALANAGCVAFSNDGSAVSSSGILRNSMEYAHGIGKIIIEHCEDLSFTETDFPRSMNEGITSALMGIEGDPDISEATHVSRAILLSEYLSIPIHIAHVSSQRSVRLIEEAKRRNSLITAETCPHYLFLDDTAVKEYNGLAKVNPPLRTQEDVYALRSAIVSGVIDILATDHAPHTLYEKNQPLLEAPFGLSGLDLALSLTWRLVEENILTEEDLIRLWCIKPHSRFSLPYNDFKKGAIANFFLFDDTEEWLLTPEAMYSKGKNTPFMGEKMKGRVVSHWIGGIKIV